MLVISKIQFYLVGVVIIYGILSFFVWALLFYRCSYSVSKLSVSSVGDEMYLFFCILPCYQFFSVLVLVYSSLEVFCNGVSLCPALWAPCFASSNLGVSSVSKILLLLHISNPLPVHRMRMNCLGISSVYYTYRVSF